jgi:hypothetical protein
MDAHGDDGPVREVVGVYAAAGGLVGEVRYLVGALFGRAHCTLCDITHSPVRRKRAWDELVARLPLPMRVVHRNELPPELVAHVQPDELPAVYAVTASGTVRRLVTRDELGSLGGSVEAFERLLVPRLRE